MLPAYQQSDLRGLWVGDYGPHGKELVNVSVQQDGTVIGRKLTGDRNVPARYITFEVPGGAKCMYCM